MIPINNGELHSHLTAYKPRTTEHGVFYAEMKNRGFKTVEDLEDAKANDYGLHPTLSDYIRACERKRRDYLLGVVPEQAGTGGYVSKARELVQQAELLNAAANGEFTLQIRFTLHTTDCSGCQGVADKAIELAAAAYGVSPTEIFGRGRTKTVSTARILAFAVITAWLRDCPAEEIVGRFLGRKRFNSYYYNQRHAKYLRQNKDYKNIFTTILQSQTNDNKI